MKTENQLQFVRDALSKMPRGQWNKVAAEAGVTLRTVYNICNENGRPGYDVVFKVYGAMKSGKLAKVES